MRIARLEACRWRVGLSLLIVAALAPPAWGQSLGEANRLNSQVIELYQQGRYQEAIPLAKRALAIEEKVLGKDNPLVAPTRIFLELLYQQAGLKVGDHPQAEPHHKKAPSLTPPVGGRSREEAERLSSHALKLSQQGRYQEAIPLTKRALAIAEKTLPKDHPFVVASFYNLAALYNNLGDFGQAAPLMKRALAIAEKALPKDHPLVIASLDDLAGIYGRLGDYSQAEPLYKRVLAIAEKTLPKDHPNFATSLNNLASLYQTRGDYSQAEPLYKRVLAIYERVDKNHPNVAATLGNLAVLYDNRGDYSQAEPLLKKALAIQEKVHREEHLDVAASLNNLANFYSHLGDFGQAAPLMKRALAIAEKTLPKDHPGFAGILNNLAALYDSLGRYSEAEPLYKRALAIREQTLGKDHPHVATSLNNLAALYLEMGRGEEAFTIFKKQDVPTGLGRYYLSKREYQPAREQFLRSLKTTEKSGEPHFILADYIGLGLAFEGEGNYPKAKESFSKAIELIEGQWSTLTLSARQHFLSGKVGAGFSRLEPYEGMVRVLLKERRPGYEKEALRYAERVKSRTFLELLAGRGVKGRRAVDQQVLAQDRQHQQKLTELTQRILVIQGLGSKAPQGEEKRLQQELEQRQAEYERFLNEVKLKDLELASLIGTEAIAIEKLQSLLDPDTTLLEYYTAKDRLYAWLVRRDAIQVQELPLPQKALEQEVNTLLLPNISTRPRAAAPVITLPIGGGHTTESSLQERERNRTQFTQKTEGLYQKLLAPLTKSIKTKQLLIVPHGVLHKLPFAALGDQQGLLIDKHSVAVLPALSVLQYIVQKRNPDQGRLLALANPVLDYVPGYAELSGADAEVKQVSQYFKEKAVYRGREATEGLLRRNTAKADVIHLAVHGEFNDRQPLQSGLLLAKDADYNGPLQVHELFDLDLEGVNLVVASACETALSRIQGGDDLVGLSRGFIYAGTPSLIATLWKVDDASTAQLMERFYKNWREQGMSKAEALRQAQQTLRAMPAYRHPYYWAPFILIGDWQ